MTPRSSGRSAARRRHHRAVWRPTSWLESGAGSEFTVDRFPCIRRLPQRKRAIDIRALALLHATTPVGPSFCVMVVLLSHPQLGAEPGGFCDTFADAADGYGANEIAVYSSHPALASIVPDDVARVVLRYHRHPPIIAHVHDNTYWVTVPDYIRTRRDRR